MSSAAPVATKPRLRGVFHEVGFYVALGLAIPLSLNTDGDRARISAIVFSSCLIACFGVSALYHRPAWTPKIRSRLARADHAALYLLIAGTYTPFGLLVLSPAWSIPLLTVIWAGVVGAIILKLSWPGVPKRISATIGIALGWVGVIGFSQLLKLPDTALALVLAGGIAYTIGGIAYARERPNPIPNVLGYHEVFHLLTLVGAGLQYAAIAFYVLPRG